MTEPPGLTTSIYTQREDWLNCAVHVAGLLASCIAIPVLALAGWRSGDPWLLAGGLVFGVSALLMFATSALYHSARDPAVRLRLRRVDHAAIYVLIAGTYTPFTLGALQGAWGWSLAAVIWTMPATASVQTTAASDQPHAPSSAPRVNGV